MIGRPDASRSANSKQAKNDFAQFKPWLEKIVALKVQEAQAVGYQGVPYDALLDEYEPGVTTAAGPRTSGASISLSTIATGDR